MGKCYIACNFTNELVELLKENEINIDYIKWPSFNQKYISIDETAKYGKPILLHGFNGYFDYYVSNDISKENKAKEIENSVKMRNLGQKYNLPYYSAHLGGMISMISEIKWNGIYCTKEEKEYLIEQTVNNIIGLKKVLDKEIIIENIPIFKGNPKLEKFPECVGKTDFISKIVYKADIDLLLDIAHARVNASVLNLNIYEYLDRLPLERVREIHISGVKKANIGQLVDFHNEIDKKDIELLKYVMKKSRKLQFVTLEFTPQEKDFYLLDKNEENKYQTVEINDINLEAKELLKNDVKILENIVSKYNLKNGN